MDRQRQSAVPVYVAAGAIFAALAGRSFLVPLRAHELGADRFTVGLLFTVSTLAAALLSIPAGFLADRLGHRAMVAASAVLGGVSQLAIALTADVHLYLVWQVVGGLGAGAAQAALFAAVADASPGSRLGRSMGWLTLAMQVGFLAGPALTGVLLQFFDLRGDLVVSTALYLVAAAPTVFFVPAQRRGTGWDFRRPLRAMARSRGFVAVILGLFAATLLWGTTQAYLPLFSKEVLLLPGAGIGYLLAIQAVANGLSRVPGGRIVDGSVRKGPIVAAGILGYAAAVLVLPHLGGFWAPALLLAAAVPFLATAFVALGVAFSTLAPAEGSGIAMGVYSAVLFVGLSAGPLFFGPLMDRGGYTAGFSAAAVTSGALALAMLSARAFGRRGRPAVVLPPAAPGT